MKTALYLTAWGLMEVFGFNPAKYAQRIPPGFLHSVAVEDLENLCTDILTDGAAAVAKKTGYPVSRGIIYTVYDVELWLLLNRINGEMREKLSIIDPHRDFPKLHSRKFEPSKSARGVYRIEFE